MTTSTKTMFASVIEAHLALKQRNATLEPAMPLEQFIGADPFDNHALFKTEEAARLEEEETGEHPVLANEWAVATISVDAAGEEAWLDRQQCSDFNWGD